MFLLAYKKFSGLISPSVQLLGIFFVGFFCYATQLRKWNTDIELKTMLVILSGLFCFFLGEAFSSKVRIGKTYYESDNTIQDDTIYVYQDDPFFIPARYMVPLLFVEIITLIFYFRFTYSISLEAGNPFGYAGMINYAYIARLDGVDTPTLLTIGWVVSRCFSAYCIFVLIHNMKVKCRKGIVILSFSILLYFIMTFLQGGRTSMFRVFVQIITTYIFVYGVHQRGTGQDLKIIRKVLVLGILCLVAFNIYGVLRNSDGTGFEKIFRYPALSIQAFNVYLENPRQPLVFGEETLISLRSIISRFGINTFSRKVQLDAVTWTGDYSNIYTGMRRYYTDFGLLGLCMIMFFLGCFYGEFKKRVVNSTRIRTIVLYGLFSYPVIEMLFEERFFIGLISFGTVYFVVCTLLLEKIVRAYK